MCVIFFYANAEPSPGGYKLILASNRDEFYARETQQVGKWSQAQHVYGGIDLEPGREGGTWLAIGHHQDVFKVGALLNLTGEPKPRNAIALNILQPHQQIPTNNEHFLLGRGMIVADYVKESSKEFSSMNYNRRLLKDCNQYSAFNFVSIEITPTSAQIQLLSNVPPTLAQFEPGKSYGFGNSLPSSPFQKVSHGQQQFEATVREHGNASVDVLSSHLLELLKNKHKFWPDPELQRRAPNWGEGLSSLNVFIDHQGYGSRTHTVILVDSQNKMHFIEETMAGVDPEGEWLHKHIEKQF
ncbi:LOW QUALITY PROTEIN: transport and Golgi organization protein 2 [Drosophila tropicalis]|uniref:LOW QUALITY PROTEIN: transport and Golgi organization protein 2 n=1 Tax=Drosophila tropicalis TaxID=46794 RepID=UPI0035ABCEFD